MALFGWVRAPVLRTRLSIFNVNAPSKRVPQVHEVGDDDTLVLLRGDFLRQQGSSGNVKLTAWPSKMTINWLLVSRLCGRQDVSESLEPAKQDR
jgi:hypothetical protein